MLLVQDVDLPITPSPITHTHTMTMFHRYPKMSRKYVC